MTLYSCGLSNLTAEYSGEFSYLNFSMKIRQKIDEWMQTAAPEVMTVSDSHRFVADRVIGINRNRTVRGTMAGNPTAVRVDVGVHICHLSSSSLCRRLSGSNLLQICPNEQLLCGRGLVAGQTQHLLYGSFQSFLQGCWLCLRYSNGFGCRNPVRAHGIVYPCQPSLVELGV